MKLNYILALALIMNISLSSANEYKIPPPVNLMLLSFDKVFVADPKLGSHGLKEYCYQTNDSFTIYSVNALGEGYSFLKNEPNMACLETELKINNANILGLKVGLTLQEVSNILGISVLDGLNSFSWNYQRAIHNLPYDDITNLDIIIQNGFVSSIKVFNIVVS